MEEDQNELPGRPLQFLRALYFEDTLNGETFNFPVVFNLTQFTHQTIMMSCLKNGYCDPGLVRAMLSWLRPGDTFVDIGANLGYFSILASKYVGPSGTVHCFEPNPVAFSTLSLNISVNKPKNLHLYPWAISDKDGLLNFYMVEEDDGISSLAEENTIKTGQDTHRNKTTVQSYSIDTLNEKGVIPPCRVMKLDIEGCEDMAVSGGENYFRELKADTVVFEINNNVSRSYDEQKLRAVFCEMGYQCYLIKPFGDWAARYQAAFKDALTIRVDGAPLPFQLPVGNILAINPKAIDPENAAIPAPTQG